MKLSKKAIEELKNSRANRQVQLSNAYAEMGGSNAALKPSYALADPYAEVKKQSLPVLEKAVVDQYEKKDTNVKSRVSPILSAAAALSLNPSIRIASNLIKDTSYQDSRQQNREAYNEIKNREAEKALESTNDPEIFSMPTIMGMGNGSYGMNSAGVSREDAQRVYNKKNKEKNEKRMKDFATKNPVLASLGAIVSNPLESGIGVAQNIGNYLAGKPLEENYAPSSTIRETVTNNINLGNDKATNLARLGYGGLNSLGDMAFAALLSAPLGGAGLASKGAAGLMGLEKASDTMNDAVNRGLNPNQIIGEGAASGVSTAITEALPFEKFAKGGNVLGAMLSEGLQEGSEDLVDTLFDELITRAGGNNEKSSYNLMYKSYIDAGYSEEEAKRATINDYIKQVGIDAALGGITGGIMGAGGNLMQGNRIFSGKPRNIPSLETNVNENADTVNETVNEKVDTIDSLTQEREANDRLKEDYAQLNELLKQQEQQTQQKPIESLTEKPVDLNEVKAIAEETENAIPEVQSNPAETIAQKRESRDLLNLAQQYKDKLSMFEDSDYKVEAKSLNKAIDNAIESNDMQALRDTLANVDSVMSNAEVGTNARKYNKEALTQMQQATDGYKIKVSPELLHDLNLDADTVSKLDTKYANTGSRNRIHFVSPKNENGVNIDAVYDEIADKSGGVLPKSGSMNQAQMLSELINYINNPKAARGEMTDVRGWNDVSLFDNRSEGVIEAENLSDTFVDNIINGNIDNYEESFSDFMNQLTELANKYPEESDNITGIMLSTYKAIQDMPRSTVKLDDDIKAVDNLEDAVSMLEDEAVTLSQTLNYFSEESDASDNETEDLGRVNTGRKKTSKTYPNTGLNSGIMTEEEQELHDNDESMLYIENSEKESVAEAHKRIRENGTVNERKRLLNKNGFNNVDVDEAMTLWKQLSDKIRQLKENGLDYQRELKQAHELFTKIKEEASGAGSALQALAKWSRNNTPEGLFAEAMAIIHRAEVGTDGRVDWSKQVAKETKGKTDKMDIDFMDRFMTEAEKLNGLDIDSPEAKLIMAKLGKMVNSQIPITLREKITTLLMDNMLGNARTLLTRNAGGNFGFNMLEDFLRRPLSAVIDAGLSKKSGVRTTLGLDKNMIKAGLEGFKEGFKQDITDFHNDIISARTGENTLANATANNRNALTSKIGHLYNKLVKSGLSIGDRMFYEKTYKMSMAEYQAMYDKGMLGDMSKKDFEQLAKAYSQLNALTAVYQDNTLISQAFLDAKKAVNEASKGMIGADIMSQFTMPFVKTPANIIQRALEYSPLGIVKNAIQTVRDLKTDGLTMDVQRRISTETARNIIGTAMFVGSMALANSGRMTGGYSDDKDMKQAQKESGMQEFALHNPFGINADVDVSWIPVIGNNLVAGAAAYDAMNKPDMTFDQKLGAGIGAGLESQFESSMLQGLQRLLGATQFSRQGSDKGILGNAADTVKSGASQFIPSLLRQAAAASDPMQRQLSGVNTDDYYKNNLISAIPGLRETLQPKIGRTGEELEQNHAQTVGGRIFNTFLNPATVTYGTPDAVRDEAMRLFESTGNNVAFQPSVSIGDLKTEDHIPTPEEYTEYQKNAYGAMNSIASDVIGSDYYQSLTDGDKEELLADIYSAVKSVEKTKALKGDTEKFSGAAKAYYEDGADGLIRYMTARQTLNELGLQNNQTNRDKVYEKLDEGGTEAVQEMVQQAQELQDAGLDTNMQFKYEHAANYLPSLTPTEFADTWNDINTDNNTSIKQSEVIDYLNQHPDRYTDETALQYWNAFDQKAGHDGAWKKIPVLNSETGLWEAKQGTNNGTTTRSAATQTTANTNIKDKYGIGQYGKGNIDLYARPQYRYPDGSVATVESMSFNIDGKEVLIPTIAYDSKGRAVKLTDDQAIQRYYDTGEYLGKFDTVKEADNYANKLHLQQEELYSK